MPRSDSVKFVQITYKIMVIVGDLKSKHNNIFF